MTLRTSFRRDGRDYMRCSTCGAFLRTTPPGANEVDDLYDSGEFTESIERHMGESSATPDTEKFREFEWCLRTGSLLEVGPGTGHYLAAARDAGFEVSGIELSASQRGYIRRT